MGKQDVLDAIRGLPTKRAPWVPYVGVHAAHLIGQPAERYFQDPELIAEGVLYAATRYKADGIPLLFDTSIEAISMGCEYRWWPDSPPSIVEHPLRNCSLRQSGIQIPGPTSGRWPIVISAGKKLKAQLGDVALYGVLCGPLTLAWYLRGIAIYTDLYKNEAEAKELISYCGEVAREAARIYAEDIGCDVLAMIDPLVSQIKPDVFRKYVYPAAQPAIEVARESGKASVFLVYGDATEVLEEVAQVGTDGFAVDEQLNLAYARDVAHKYGVGFGGNLKVTTALSLGIISPREDAIACLAAGGTRGYVFSPGSDLPYDVPPDHIDQVLEAADWFSKHYTRYPVPRRESG
ncbi:MAG: uroporphyrinogen decarboxylase family protein [Thermodesulfobacteriota bacterium]